MQSIHQVCRKELVVDIITLSFSFIGLVYSVGFFLPVVVIEEGLPMWVITGACMCAIGIGFSVARIINYVRGCKDETE